MASALFRGVAPVLECLSGPTRVCAWAAAEWACSAPRGWCCAWVTAQSAVAVAAAAAADVAVAAAAAAWMAGSAGFAVRAVAVVAVVVAGNPAAAVAFYVNETKC